LGTQEEAKNESTRLSSDAAETRVSAQENKKQKKKKQQQKNGSVNDSACATFGCHRRR
jgi:hypothetical protein